jgi:hypothetical protein
VRNARVNELRRRYGRAKKTRGRVTTKISSKPLHYVLMGECHSQADHVKK